MKNIVWIQWGTFGAVVFIFATACQVLDKGGPSLETIMKDGFKNDDALQKKIVAGNATQSDRDLFVAYAEALAGKTPPHGSPESWKKKTAALIAAAKDVQGGDGDLPAFKEAVNCKQCHIVHRYAPGKSPY